MLPPFAAWLRATSLGWLLGLPLVAALALAGEAAGVGGAQVFVGLGVGAGVGLVQARALRPVLGRGAPWALASSAGLAVPFLVSDLSGRFGWGLGYSLQWCVVAGGVLVGCAQAVLWRPRVTGAAWWAAASAVGWALAGGAAGLADAIGRGASFRGLAGAGLYLALVAGGGLVLGAVTGGALRLLRLRAAPG